MLFEVVMLDLMASKNRGYSVTKKPSLRSLVTALMYSTLVVEYHQHLRLRKVCWKQVIFKKFFTWVVHKYNSAWISSSGLAGQLIRALSLSNTGILQRNIADALILLRNGIFSFKHQGKEILKENLDSKRLQSIRENTCGHKRIWYPPSYCADGAPAICFAWKITTFKFGLHSGSTEYWNFYWLVAEIFIAGTSVI